MKTIVKKEPYLAELADKIEELNQAAIAICNELDLLKEDLKRILDNEKNV